MVQCCDDISSTASDTHLINGSPVLPEDKPQDPFAGGGAADTLLIHRPRSDDDPPRLHGHHRHICHTGRGIHVYVALLRALEHKFSLFLHFYTRVASVQSVCKSHVAQPYVAFRDVCGHVFFICVALFISARLHALLAASQEHCASHGAYDQFLLHFLAFLLL